MLSRVDWFIVIETLLFEPAVGFPLVFELRKMTSYSYKWAGTVKNVSFHDSKINVILNTQLLRIKRYPSSVTFSIRY